MVITADERRSKLGLFNVSEAARSLDVSVRQIHFDLKGGWIPKPTIQFGKRFYYHADDLPKLAECYAAIKNHP